MTTQNHSVLNLRKDFRALLKVIKNIAKDSNESLNSLLQKTIKRGIKRGKEVIQETTQKSGTQIRKYLPDLQLASKQSLAHSHYKKIKKSR